MYTCKGDIYFISLFLWFLKYNSIQVLLSSLICTCETSSRLSTQKDNFTWMLKRGEKEKKKEKNQTEETIKQQAVFLQSAFLCQQTWVLYKSMCLTKNLLCWTNKCFLCLTFCISDNCLKCSYTHTHTHTQIKLNRSDRTIWCTTKVSHETKWMGDR